MRQNSVQGRWGWAAVGAGLWLAMASAPLQAEEPPKFTPEQLEFFEKQVRPVLVQHCQDCHGKDTAEAGLQLDSRHAILKGGESGPAIILGKPGDSRLIKAIRYDGSLQMPPDKKLPPEAVEALAKWVEIQAPWPEEQVVAGAAKLRPTDPEAILKARQEHWAFQPVKQPPLPHVKQKDWVRNEVDTFILAELEARGLTPSPAADRRTLIRRVTIDMHGIPPTTAEVDAFVADKSPDAWEKVIDRLLAAPEYGQRWGRHWLDLARYADTKGYVFQEERKYPFAYTYRDYVIRALNEDLPYDRFVVEQLAADKLDLKGNPQPLAAMGFLTVGRRFLNNQHDIIDDRIDVVMRGLQGLTVGCARCHDHKFDPIPTADYYSMYGVFISSNEPKDLPLLTTPERTPAVEAFEKELKKREGAVEQFIDEQHTELQKAARSKFADYLLTAEELRGKPGDEQKKLAESRGLLPRTLERWQRRLAQGKAEHDQVLGPFRQLQGLPEDQFATKFAELTEKWKAEPDAKTTPLANVRETLTAQPVQNRKELADRYAALFATLPAALDDQGLAAANAGQKALQELLYSKQAPSHINRDEVQNLLRRDIRNKLSELRKKVDQFRGNDPNAPPRAMVMVDNPNPQNIQIFKRGNPNNRGEQVERRFLEVLTPDRKPFKNGSGRLELAEAIASKDNPLTARVLVNRVWQHHFGRGLVDSLSDFGVRTPLPTHPALLDYLASQFMANGWSQKKLHRQILLSQTYQQSSAMRKDTFEKDPENRYLARMNRRRLDFEAMRDSLLTASGQLDRSLDGRPVDIINAPYTHRRTVYGFIDRQNLEGLFRTFDFASPDAHTPQRYETTVPQQALYLLNHPFVMEQAAELLDRQEVEGEESPEQKIRAIYRVLFARQPSSHELELGLAFVNAQKNEPESAPELLVAWQAGYGKTDEPGGQVISFDVLPHWTGTTWQGSDKMPDPKLGYLNVHATGGHPERDRAVIRRWTAPMQGTVSIGGVLKHPSKEGDGVRGRVISSRQGRLGEWTIHNGQVETKIDTIEVDGGETLDFVVDARTNEAHDSFNWAPIIRRVGNAGNPAPGGERVWNAERDFARTGPSNAKVIDGWTRYAQVLLLSNEFGFVD